MKSTYLDTIQMLSSIILEIRNRKQQMNAMRRVIQLLPQVYWYIIYTPYSILIVDIDIYKMLIIISS